MTATRFMIIDPLYSKPFAQVSQHVKVAPRFSGGKYDRPRRLAPKEEIHLPDIDAVLNNDDFIAHKSEKHES